MTFCSSSSRRCKLRVLQKSRGGPTTKIHMVTASDHSVVAFSLSGGNAHDAPGGEMLLEIFTWLEEQQYILMDRAYEGNSMCSKAIEKGFIPIVTPKRNRKESWGYEKEHYKQKNEFERYFLRLKCF